MSRVFLTWESWTFIQLCESNKQIIPSAIGGLCKESDKKGDGYFCEKCLDLGKYSWIDHGSKVKCPGIGLGWHK